MKKKKFNKTATIKNIIAKVNQSIGISIDMEGFNKKIKAVDGNEFVKEAAEFLDVEIVYN